MKEEFIKEQKELRIKIKSSKFISPKDMWRYVELTHLIMWWQPSKSWEIYYVPSKIRKVPRHIVVWRHN